MRSCRRAFEVNNPVGADVRGIPEVNLLDLLTRSRPAIRIDASSFVDGSIAFDEALALLSIVAAERPQAVLEIGTFMGRTTKWMAWNMDGGIVHTVDLPEDFAPKEDTSTLLPKSDFSLIARRNVGREYRNDPASSRIVQHFADTSSWDFTEAGMPSFFFIDGSHTYEYCLNDSEKCLALCNGRPATFLWHDCDRGHPGVVRCLLEWRAQGRNVVRISGTSIAYWKKTASERLS